MATSSRPAPIAGFELVERPLVRLRLAIEQAERELECIRRAYAQLLDLATGPPHSSCPEETAPLSRQERLVALLLARGASNHEIAAELHVSIHTVKSHVRSILRKRCLRSRWQLVEAPE